LKSVNSLNERRRNKITTIKSGVNGKGLGSDPFHLIEIFRTGKSKCTRNITTTNNREWKGGSVAMLCTSTWRMKYVERMSEKTSTSPLPLLPELNTNKCNYFRLNSLNERRRNKITTIKSGINGKGLGNDPFHLIEIFPREERPNPR